jgi:hypothetical protein
VPTPQDGIGNAEGQDLGLDRFDVDAAAVELLAQRLVVAAEGGGPGGVFGGDVVGVGRRLAWESLVDGGKLRKSHGNFGSSSVVLP